MPVPAPRPWPALPDLPTTFSARIEANIVNKNYSIVTHEWADEPNNVGRVDSYRVRNISSGVTERSSTLYLYDR